MEIVGFGKALSHLIFCKKRLLVILVTILKTKSLSWDFPSLLFTS